MLSDISKRNLLVITNGFPNSNQTFVQGIFIKKQLDSIKHYFNQIMVICPIPNTLQILRKDKLCKNYSYENIVVRFPRYTYYPILFHKLRLLSISRAIRKEIQKTEFQYDIVHSHFGPMGVVTLKLDTKKPLITSFYGYDAYQYNYDSLYYQDLFTESSFILTLSNHMSKRLTTLNCPEKKLVKMHIGIDLDYYKSNNSIRNKNNDTIILTCVANFVEKKGILDSIKAFSILVKKHDNIHLNLVGDGPLKNMIKELIHSLKLEEKISIINNYATMDPQKTVLENLQKCDIFVLLSKVSSSGDSEGTPVVLMEASACEKPCITTNHSGNPEVVIDQVTGIVIPEGDVKETSAAIEWMILNVDKRKLMGKNARENIKKNFNVEIQSKKLIEFYSDIFENQ